MSYTAVTETGVCMQVVVMSATLEAKAYAEFFLNPKVNSSLNADTDMHAHTHTCTCLVSLRFHIDADTYTYVCVYRYVCYTWSKGIRGVLCVSKGQFEFEC